MNRLPYFGINQVYLIKGKREEKKKGKNETNLRTAFRVPPKAQL